MTSPTADTPAQPPESAKPGGSGVGTAQVARQRPDEAALPTGSPAANADTAIPPQQHSGPSRHDLMDAINSLPERLGSVIKEAFPSAPPQPTDSQNSGTTQTQDRAHDGDPGKSAQSDEVAHRKTFADWWFGGSRLG